MVPASVSGRSRKRHKLHSTRKEALWGAQLKLGLLTLKGLQGAEGKGGSRDSQEEYRVLLPLNLRTGQKARSGEGLSKRKGQEETYGVQREGLRRKRQKRKCCSALLLTLQKVQKSRVARIGGSPRATQLADSLESPGMSQ